MSDEKGSGDEFRFRYVENERVTVDAFPTMDCGCPFSNSYTCPMCGHSRITNHCEHDRVQNPCPKCEWIEPGKRTPSQFLGWKPSPPRT